MGSSLFTVSRLSTRTTMQLKNSLVSAAAGILATVGSITGQPINSLKYGDYFIKNAFSGQVMSVPLSWDEDSYSWKGGQLLIENKDAKFKADSQLFHFHENFDGYGKFSHFEILNRDSSLCLTIGESGIFKNSDNVFAFKECDYESDDQKFIVEATSCCEDQYYIKTKNKMSSGWRYALGYNPTQHGWFAYNENIYGGNLHSDMRWIFEKYDY